MVHRRGQVHRRGGVVAAARRVLPSTATARRPRMVWLVTAVALGVMAFGLTGLKANNLLQNKDVRRSKPEAVTGEQALDRHFPAGSGDPVQVIGRSPAAPQLQAALADTPGSLPSARR
jgi:RND superfamily putative drug exporter